MASWGNRVSLRAKVCVRANVHLHTSEKKGKIRNPPKLPSMISNHQKMSQSQVLEVVKRQKNFKKSHRADHQHSYDVSHIGTARPISPGAHITGSTQQSVTVVNKKLSYNEKNS
jgi:hypothetical protein